MPNFVINRLEQTLNFQKRQLLRVSNKNMVKQTLVKQTLVVPSIKHHLNE